MLERDLLAALDSGEPFAAYRDIGIRRLTDPGEDAGFDAAYELESGTTKVKIFVEAKSRCTAASIASISPWIARTRKLLPGGTVVLACEYIPPPVQVFCFENDINFIDLAGNISINVPGVLLLRQTGRTTARSSRSEKTTIQNPFSSRSSRVIRVLLEKPGGWRVSSIANELAGESQRNVILRSKRSPVTKTRPAFAIDPGSISRVLDKLDEDLLVRRRKSEVIVAEPRRLLRRWAERYEERYRWRLRSSFLSENPLGATPSSVAPRLRRARYAFTGVAAASLAAPYVDPDTFDLFVVSNDESAPFRGLTGEPAGPRFRIILPYDIGVFMYARIEKGIPIVSPIQSYLDAWASGGRGRKQADYLLANVIEPRWKSG